jgi:hypothetical protein
MIFLRVINSFDEWFRLPLAVQHVLDVGNVILGLVAITLLGLATWKRRRMGRASLKQEARYGGQD